MNKTAAAIFLRNGKILLEKRGEDEDNYAGLWAIPGGHLHKNEPAGNALVREMFEELGARITECKFIAALEDLDKTSKQRYRHHFFLCIKWRGRITKSAECEKVKWQKLGALRKLKMAQVDLKAIKLAFESKARDIKTHLKDRRSNNFTGV